MNDRHRGRDLISSKHSFMFVVVGKVVIIPLQILLLVLGDFSLQVHVYVLPSKSANVCHRVDFEVVMSAELHKG